MKKVISMILVLCMALGLFTGCGQKESAGNSGKTESADQVTEDKDTESDAQESEEAAIDISEEVTVKLITITGEKHSDFDRVLGLINEKLKSKVNATLEVELFSWSDWADKYPLAFASGENFDMIYTSSWCFYPQQAAKGGFLELTDEMLKTYAPLSYASISKGQWAETKIDGKCYMVPFTKRRVNNYNMILLRGDLREKYNIPEVTDMESYYTYLEMVAEQDDIIAYNAGGSGTTELFFNGLLQTGETEGLYPISFGGYVGIAIDIPASLESGETVYRDVLEDETYMSLYKKMKELREKNVWSQNTLSNNTVAADAFKNGASASVLEGFDNIAEYYVTLNEEHPDWKLEIVDLCPEGDLYALSCASDGVGIYANSKHPERTLMVLDLLRCDEEISNLWRYGIEGEHWEAVGDTGINQLKSYTSLAMGFITETYRRNAAYPEVSNAAFDKINAEAVNVPYMSFAFDSSAVKTEYAAVSAVAGEYYPILVAGFADDIEGTWKEFREKAEAAGLDTLLDEYKTQLEAYVAEYNK